MYAGLRQPVTVRHPPLARLAVLAIQVEHVDARHLAGRYADERAGMSAPEIAERGGVACAVLKPMWRSRRFVIATRETSQSTATE
jgi:hypothetical protein